MKIWDVVTGNLKLTLTGHIEQIRGLVPISSLLCYFGQRPYIYMLITFY